MDEINIRKPTLDDFEELYKFGESAPEMRVSDSIPYFGREVFRQGLTKPEVICFIAEQNKKIVGFVYGDVEEKDADGVVWCSLMYIAVSTELRGQGLAQKLYDEFEKEGRSRGATILYSWANAEEGSRVVPFFEKNGLKPGHLYRWMDKEL